MDGRRQGRAAPSGAPRARPGAAARRARRRALHALCGGAVGRDHGAARGRVPQERCMGSEPCKLFVQPQRPGACGRGLCGRRGSVRCRACCCRAVWQRRKYRNGAGRGRGAACCGRRRCRRQRQRAAQGRRCGAGDSGAAGSGRAQRTGWGAGHPQVGLAFCRITECDYCNNAACPVTLLPWQQVIASTAS